MVYKVARLRRLAMKSKVALVELCIREGLGWCHDNERRTEAYDVMAHQRGEDSRWRNTAWWHSDAQPVRLQGQ
jgi:hypothetical protein